MFKIPNQIPHGLEKDIKSIKEEKFNFYSHFFTFILSLIGVVFLLTFIFLQDKTSFLIPILIYAGSLLFAYYASTNYHSKYILNDRRKARILDHISIYFLIAGSYTPFLMIHVHNQKAKIILSLLWLMVVIGSVFKLFLPTNLK